MVVPDPNIPVTIEPIIIKILIFSLIPEISIVKPKAPVKNARIAVILLPRMSLLVGITIIPINNPNANIDCIVVLIYLF